MTVSNNSLPVPPRLRAPPLLLLVGLTAAPTLSTNVFVPSMPGLVQHFTTSGAMVQLTITTYLFTLGIGQLLYGPFSDRFGRRPVLLTGLAVYLLGSVCCLAAPSVELLIAARVVQAAGGCAGFIIGRAMIRDLYEPNRAASMLGYVTMSMAISVAVAPVTGAVLDSWQGWRAPFLLMTILALALVLCTWRLSGETLTMRAPLPSLWPMIVLYTRILRSAHFQRFGGYSICTSASYYAFVAGISHIVIDIYGRSPSTLGMYSISGFGYMSGNFIAGRWSERLGLQAMTRFGSCMGAVCGVLLIALVAADLRHPATVFVPVALSFVAAGISQPSAIVGAMEAAPRNVGACAGLLGALQLGVGAIASLTIGLTEHLGALPFAIISGGLLIVGLVNLMTPRRHG